MKILFYGLNYAPEQVGIGKYSAELADWLATRGHSVRVITAPPYFPAWRIAGGYLNCYLLHAVKGVRVRRCPLWVPQSPSGLTRLFHLASFALSSLGPLLAQRRWRPDVVITVVPAFFCAPGALLWVSLRSLHVHLAAHPGFRAGCRFRARPAQGPVFAFAGGSLGAPHPSAALIV